MKNFDLGKLAALHAVHCSGCSEYGGEHGGERTTDEVTANGAELKRNAGFDSPPPPPTLCKCGQAMPCYYHNQINEDDYV